MVEVQIDTCHRRLVKWGSWFYWAFCMSWVVGWLAFGLHAWATKVGGTAFATWLAFGWVPVGVAYLLLVGWGMRREGEILRAAAQSFDHGMSGVIAQVEYDVRRALHIEHGLPPPDPPRMVN